MSTWDAIVLGAGPAGLASAQQLGARGLKTLIVEKADCVGSVWRRHYDRLHLHTPRRLSALPDLPIPASYGTYPSRDQIIDYFESYAKTFRLSPHFGVNARAVRRDDELWRVDADNLSASAPIVVVATGWADFPNRPVWPGEASFGGPVLHSSAYRNAAPFKGKRVLVIGFGNSGAEIALDLCEGGAETTISVRSPVCVVPRDLLGLPILEFSTAQRFLPPRWADAINAPVLRLAVGSLEPLGFRTAAKGPVQMTVEDGRVPVLDIGAIAKIRQGKIKVRGDIRDFAPGSVNFVAGAPAPFDAVILATGFAPNLAPLLPDAASVLDAHGRPRISDAATSERGLYFVGAIPNPIGQLRQIALGARHIADDAQRLLSSHR